MNVIVVEQIEKPNKKEEEEKTTILFTLNNKHFLYKNFLIVVFWIVPINHHSASYSQLTV